jgi:hypothetical protein
LTCKTQKRPTANEILRKDRLAILRHIRTAIDLEWATLVVANAVRVKGCVPPHLVATLLQVLDEQTLYHALVYKQDVRIQHVDDRRVVNFAAEPMEGLVSCAAPEGDVVDPDAAL